jgi:hypothetical protein
MEVSCIVVVKLFIAPVIPISAEGILMEEDHLFGPSSTLSNAALVRFHLEEDFDGCGAQDDKGVWDDEGSDDEGTGV